MLMTTKQSLCQLSIMMIGFKVGYIAATLAKYLHAVWSDGLDFEVTVRHIKFRTSYLKVGFISLLT